MTNDPTGTSPSQTVTFTAFNDGMLSDANHTLGEDIFINGLSPPTPPSPTPLSPNDGLSTLGIVLISLAVILLIVVIYKVYKYKQMKIQEAAQRE